MKLSISVKSAIIWLFVLVIVVNGLGVLGRIVENLLGYEETTSLVKLFHVGLEGNITTYFSSLLLLISGVLLALIAAVKRANGERYIRHWAGLALIFFYLSLDEAVKIHELTIDPLREAFNPSGIFYYAWVIVAIPLVIIVGLIYLRFLLDLPPNTRLLFIASGAIFVFGALGMDLIAGVFLSSDWERSSAIVTGLIILEEFLENVGIALFISSLLLYMRQDPTLTVTTVELT